ncbi:MAG: molybdenum cofactor biosynthesis protein MoaE [Candidatus Nanopelagicales bacterium]
MSVHASIQDTPIDPELVRSMVGGDSDGAVAMFVGLVRNHDEGRLVTSLTYSAHPSATEKLHALAARAVERAGVSDVAAVHRVGDLEVGEVAVVTAVSGPHRRAVLETNAWLIDSLKAEAPIWKQQHHPDGSSDWVGLP